MKTITLIFLLIFLFVSSHAQQWSGNDNTNDNIWRSGKIGIGTDTPNSLLSISSSTGGGLISIIDKENDESTANPYIAYYYGSTQTRLGYVGYGSSGNKDLYLTNDKGGLRFRDNTGEIMYVKEGKIGVGTINPNSLFSVSSSTGGGLISIIDTENDESTANPYIAYYYGATQTRLGYIGYGSTGNKDLYLTNDKGGLRFRDNTGEVMLIHEGNLLIGKTTQQNNIYKLDVNGSIRANEIKVNLDGADFVFEQGYKLKSLMEVEFYIKENKRLPEIASADEMSKDGADLGELNTKLLQKIEELTLYVIDLQKQIDGLKSQLNEHQ